MTTLADPPRFSDADINLEKRRIALIDQLLAEKGAMKIDDLHKYVQETDRLLFATLDMLKSFIQMRSNIFEADEALTAEIRNRSIEYREAMFYIVEKLAKSTKQQNVNFIFAELGLHFPTMKKCEVGSGDAAAYKFMYDHKSILAFRGPVVPKADLRPVGLYPLAWTIPSVWINETLPKYNTMIVRYDRSITIKAVGCVVHSVKRTNFLKLEITDGCPYAGQSVYVLGKNVGCHDIDLTERYPRQSLVKFTAFRAYFVAQPWTASSIKDSSGKEVANVNEQHRTLASQQSSSIADDTSQSAVVINIRSDLAAEAQVGNAVTSTLTEKNEQNLLKLVDSIVGGQKMLVHSLWTHLKKKQANCLWSKDEAALGQFLRDRPHLYFVDQDSVTLRSTLHRSVVAQVIKDLKNGVEYTMNSIGARIGRRAPAFKLDVYGSGNQWIHKFIQDHQTLLEVVGSYDPKNPLAQSVQLRQTLITTEKPIKAPSSSSEERSISSSEASQKLYSPAAIELSESAIKMTSKKDRLPSIQRPSYETLVDREMNRKAKIDNYLEVFGELHIGTLFEKLALSQSDTFSDYYELVEYLCIRSHLYAVHPVSKSVSRQPTDYRRAVTLLLSRCSASNDPPVEDLWQLAHLSNDGTFNPIVNQCASKLEFEDFLKEHELLFEMTEVIDDNKNRFVHARGTYDVDSHVFLPRYYL